MAKIAQIKKERKPKEKMFGNNIKKILDETGMVQQELADIALGGDTSHLSRIMNGKRKCISLPIAIKIAQALNKPVEQVFIYKEHENEKTKS